MDLRGWARALRKGWWIVLVATVLAVGVGVAITLLTPKQYASSVTFFVRTPADQIAGAFQGDAFAQKRVNSYVQLADSRALADLVVADSGVTLTPNEVRSRISAKGDLNTVLLTVTVTDTDPLQSLRLAESISGQFVSLVSSIETSPGSSLPTVSLVVTSAAALNPTPVSPLPGINIGLALVIGALVGVVVAVLREVLDTTIRTVEGLGLITHAPVLATIPFDKAAKSSPLIADTRTQSVRVESFRQLRTNLQFADVDNPVRVIVVTSSLPSDGKSSTATNLAVSFADAGQRVLLVEADLRRPRVAQYLGLEGSVGLTNVLAGQVAVEDVLQSWGRGGLTVLPSGAIPPNPSELLGSATMLELLDSLRASFDMIILDTPPLLPVTDGAVVARHADGAVVVVRHGHSTKAQLSASVKALAAVDARLLGCVLNMVPLKGPDGYGYGYGYGSEYGADPAGPEPDQAEASETIEPAPADSGSSSRDLERAGA